MFLEESVEDGYPKTKRCCRLRLVTSTFVPCSLLFGRSIRALSPYDDTRFHRKDRTY